MLVPTYSPGSTVRRRVRDRVAPIMSRCAGAGLFLLAAPGLAEQDATTRITIDAGVVRGTVDGGVASWKGIPFAAPPVGALRWKAPQPIHWDGERDASAYGHDCMQKPFPSDAAPLGTAPSEDCLVLNVWRPAQARTPLPVMVWIYGGGYVNGGSSPRMYAGAKFAEQGVLFVSFNYRLGRFGFFAHPALSAEGAGGPLGNYALMDQIAALQWVKRNIARFGGDPANVTVFGESAGGNSVLNLIASPAAHGLFARAAVMSGGGRQGFQAPVKLRASTPGTLSAEERGVRFAAAHGIAGDGPEALAALRALPAEAIVGGLDMMEIGAQAKDGTYTAGPIEDGVIVAGAIDAELRAGVGSAVPLMIGSNGADGCCGTASTLADVFAPFGTNAQAAQAAYAATGATSVSAAAKAVATDTHMTEPARYFASRMAAAGLPSYRYVFDYVAASKRAEWPAAPHATDIPYIFDTVDVKYGDALTKQDAQVARVAHAYYVNFARTGDPNGAGLPRWSAVRPGDGMVMRFTRDGAAIYGADPWKRRLDAVETMSGALPD